MGSCISKYPIAPLAAHGGSPGLQAFNYPQFCLLFQTFTKMPLKRLSSRPARSKLCPLFGSESSPNSSPKPLNSYLWVIERLESRGSHPAPLAAQYESASATSLRVLRGCRFSRRDISQ